MTDLRAIAKAATPGPWRMWGMELHASTCPEKCADLDHSDLVAVFLTERDGHPRTFDLQHAQAWSPGRAIAALDVIEAAKSLADYPGSTGSLRDLRAALKAWEALG